MGMLSTSSSSAGLAGVSTRLERIVALSLPVLPRVARDSPRCQRCALRLRRGRLVIGVVEVRREVDGVEHDKAVRVDNPRVEVEFERCWYARLGVTAERSERVVEERR